MSQHGADQHLNQQHADTHARLTAQREQTQRQAVNDRAQVAAHYAAQRAARAGK